MLTDSPKPVMLPLRLGRVRLFLAIAAVMAVGAAAGVAVAVPLVERAHEGDGPALLLKAMDARDVHPVEYYKAKLFRAAGLALAVAVATTGLVLAVTSPWFARRFVGEATAESLAFIRILVCAILFFDAVTIDLGEAAFFPADARLPMGVIHVLQQLPVGLNQLNASETGLRLWQAGTALFLLLAGLGWRTRVALPLAVLFYLIQGGIIRQYDRLFHTGLTPFYVLAVLCFTPCADAWSLDRRRRERRGEPVPPAGVRSAVYGWARYLCWVPFVLTYVEAGLTKIVRVGFHWWDASNMRAILIRDQVERVELRPTFIPHILRLPDLPLDAVGIATLVAESLFFVTLLSAAARFVLPLFMILMHLGIWVLQGIRFFDLVFLNLIFFDEAIVDRVRRWLDRRRADDADVASVAAATSRVAVARTGGKSLWAYPLGACAVTLVMLGVWSRQIEWYPLSSMNLYASFNGTSAIEHYRVVAHFHTGQTERVYMQDLLGLLGRTNYRQALGRGFHPEHHPEGRMARHFVRAVGAAYNREDPGPDVRQIEVQKWRWDYRAAPTEPDFGDLVDRYVVPIDPAPPRGPGATVVTRAGV